MTQPSPYIYRPSIAVACLGAIAFVAIALIAIFRTTKTKAWVLTAFLIGVFIESTALVSRAYSTTHLEDINTFLIAYLGAIIAPSFLAAGCYMVFGRILKFATPHRYYTVRKLWIPPRWITPIFVALDFLSFFIQFLGICALGAAYRDRSGDQQSQSVASGSHAVRLGLVVQLICFALFMIISLRYLWIRRHWPNDQSARSTEKGLRNLLYAIVVSSLLLTVRAIYRVFEFSRAVQHGPPGYLASHEWPYWILDATPALGVSILMTVFHVGSVLPVELITLRVRRSIASKYQGFLASFDDSNHAGDQYAMQRNSGVNGSRLTRPLTMIQPPPPAYDGNGTCSREGIYPPSSQTTQEPWPLTDRSGSERGLV